MQEQRSAACARPAARTDHREALVRFRLPLVIERFVARRLTAIMAYLDANMRLDASGLPLGLPSRLVHHFSRFSMEAMYDCDGRGAALVARAVEALRSAPVELIVAHSFGGTVALRAIWELWQQGERERRFTLITLGTASGPTVARSPMLSVLPASTSKRIAPLPNLRAWHHFWSPNDVFVGASMLPRDFEGVELHCVDTGRLSPRAHALSSYLAAPEVVECLRVALCGGTVVPPYAHAAAQAPLESVRSLTAAGSNKEK
jgi:hypothetical protein